MLKIKCIELLISFAPLTPSLIRLQFLRINGDGPISFNELLNNAVQGRPNRVVQPQLLSDDFLQVVVDGVYALPHPGVETGSPLWTPQRSYNAIVSSPPTPNSEFHVPRDVHYKPMMAPLVTV